MLHSSYRPTVALIYFHEQKCLKKSLLFHKSHTGDSKGKKGREREAGDYKCMSNPGTDRTFDVFY